jgi:hypothetical protein
MDLLEVKDRIAEAMVESIFRRARYTLVPLKRAIGQEGPVRVGREEFSPHMLVRKERDHQMVEFSIGVKYRPHIGQYLAIEHQRSLKSVFHFAWKRWPNLWFVFVTERPDPGRSCFQIVHPSQDKPDDPIAAMDLADQAEFEIFRHNVKDHEELLRRIFSLLSGG